MSIVKTEYIIVPQALKRLLPAAFAAFPRFLNANEDIGNFWNTKNVLPSFEFALDGEKIYALGRADLGDGFVNHTCNGYQYDKGRWHDLDRQLPRHLFDIEKARRIIDQGRIMVAKLKRRVVVEGYDFGVTDFETLPAKDHAKLLRRASKVLERSVDFLNEATYPAKWPSDENKRQQPRTRQ